MKYEHRILALGLLAGLAGSTTSFFLLWDSNYAVRTQVTLGVLITAIWVGMAFAIQSKVVFPLRTLSNLLGALREGDYSLRARGARLDDAMGEVVWEVSVDSSTARAHQHASGARRRPSQADVKRGSLTQPMKGSGAAGEG